MPSSHQAIEHSIQYGSQTIVYFLLHCERKTLEIAVHPDSSVVVKAPFDADESFIEAKVKKRARWIVKQQQYFNQFTPRTPQRQFIAGETHMYLGRQYRLKLSRGDNDKVKLTRGCFHVSTEKQPTPETIENMLKQWYQAKALEHYADSLDRCWKNFSRFGHEQPTISIRRMDKRWGSLSKSGTMTLNSELIKAPKECIDYVVVHELCHLLHHDHSADFYKLLESVMPNWQQVKHRLELTMA